MRQKKRLVRRIQPNATHPEGNPLGSIWRNPPKPEVPLIRSREAFPGKTFLEKGIDWVAAEETNIPLGRRKLFAKKCYDEALRRCNIAFQKARKNGPKAEAQRLGEIITWIEMQYIGTL